MLTPPWSRTNCAVNSTCGQGTDRSPGVAGSIFLKINKIKIEIKCLNLKLNNNIYINFNFNNKTSATLLHWDSWTIFSLEGVPRNRKCHDDLNRNNIYKDFNLLFAIFIDSILSFRIQIKSTWKTSCEILF